MNQTTSSGVKNKQAAPDPLAGPTAKRTQFKVYHRQMTSAMTSSLDDHRKKQRTYNEYHVSGSSVSQHQEQQQQSTLPIINAPTSLTNLAQLSGISLMPIGKINLSSKQTIGYNSTPSTKTNLSSPDILLHVDPTPPIALIHSNQITSTPIQGKRLPTVNQIGQTSLTAEPRKNIINHQPIYNLHTLPTSFHAINQANAAPESFNHHDDHIHSSTSTRNVNVSSINAESRGQFRIHSQSMAVNKFTNGNKTYGANRSTTKPHISLHYQDNNQSSHEIPKSKDCWQMLANLPEMLPAQSTRIFEDTLAQSAQDSSSNVKSKVDVKKDLDSLSLMKLMAILNNPALTITAVDPAKVPNRLYTNVDYSSSIDDYKAMSVNNLIESQQKQAANRSRTSRSHNRDYIQSSTNKGHYLQPEQANQKNRIPQSAANIQMFHEGSIDHASPESMLDKTHGTSTDQHISSDVPTQETSNQQGLGRQQKQTDLSWLSNYRLTDISISGGFEGSSYLPGDVNGTRRDDKNPFAQEKFNDSAMPLTSVRNLMLQQIHGNEGNTRHHQPQSIQLLKHIADQTKDNNTWTQSCEADKSILEPECILSISRDIKQPSLPAKKIETSKIVKCNIQTKKRMKKQIQTSKKRLYIPSQENLPVNQTNSRSKPFQDLGEIQVIDSEMKYGYVSERHSMLDSMMSENTRHTKKHISEPDEIFINRSKRVMSLIDTMVERKKRKRFERISGRQEPRVDSTLEELYAYSEDEWSCDEEIDYTGFIKTQLPLEEDETEEKRNHLLSVGLLSRNEKNKVMIDQCEEKMKIFSPLKEPKEISEEVATFVDTVLKTAGTDVQLRVDTNIKKNDLPLLEGLTRTTSRIKMYYMNSLGLEKKSKRTTLYKVKMSDNLVAPVTTKPEDLNKNKSIPPEKPQKETEAVIEEATRMASPKRPLGGASLNKLNYTTCREAMKKIPNKSDYMKSLGLIAS